MVRFSRFFSPISCFFVLVFFLGWGNNVLSRAFYLTPLCWCYVVNFLPRPLHALDATLWTFLDLYTLLMLRCELFFLERFLQHFVLSLDKASYLWTLKDLCLNSADCWSRIERQWKKWRCARMVPIGPTYRTWCKKKMMMMMMIMMMMVMMLMMMMVMMLMMMMKMVKTVMAVMAMMHKRWMDPLVAGKKIQYFARSYTGFYNDNIFPNGTTHETCEIKGCP